MSSFYDNYWNTSTQWAKRKDVITREEKLLFEENIKPGGLVLDFGCGDAARYPAFISSIGGQYFGCDVSAEAIEKALKLGLQAKVYTENKGIDAEPESFDVAICFEVLEHLVDPEIVCRDIFRVLKPGGLFLASVPNAAHWFARIEFLLTGFFNPGGSALTARKSPWNDPHIRFFSPSMFRRLFIATGFKPVQEVSEKFTFRAMPYIYKHSTLGKIAEVISFPLGWLGPLFPTLFSSRIYIVGQKPLN